MAHRGLDEVDVQSHWKYPDRPTSLEARWARVAQTAPVNAAYEAHVAATAQESIARQFRNDELIHSFAKSRISPDHPIQTWEAELFLHPIHQQTGPRAQYPGDNGLLSVSQRGAYYDRVAPVRGRGWK